MTFVFHLLDRAGVGELRQRVRPEHKAYLAAVADRIAFAGPLTSDDGQTMVGSLLAIDFPDRAAADRSLTDEPFTRAVVYRMALVLPFVNLWPRRAGCATALAP